MKKLRNVHPEHYEIIKKVASLQHLFDGLKGKLLFYGAGEHTKYMLMWLNLSDFQIKICDSYKYQENVMGYYVEKPDKDLFDWANSIIIANFYKKQEIKDYLSNHVDANKIIDLYDEQSICPFYIEEIEMEAEKTWNICPPEEYGTVDKYSLWKTSGSGEAYEKDVERAFFDSVTKWHYLNYIKPDDSVLDIGAGTGRLSVEVAKHAAKVTAVDTSEDMLKILRKKNSSIETVVVTDEKLPFADNSFDKIVSLDAMVHFINWRDFLQEHTRVVKKDGYIIYNIVNDDNLRNISEIKSVRASYISDWGGRGYCASISQEELDQVCQDIGLKLVKQIPYRVWSDNGLSYGILSRGEMHSLSKFIFDLCKNDKFMKFVKHCEQDVAVKFPADISVWNVCVFQKL